MISKSSARRLIVALTAAVVVSGASFCQAITILSGPTFTPATNAPLAGLLKLTTDVPSRVSVNVTYGTNSWQRDFYDFTTNHSLPLLGFKPDTTNEIQVTVYDENRNAYTAPQSLSFITAPLPANFPHSVVLKSDPSKMEPGYTLLIINNRATPNTNYVAIYDDTGSVVWYTPGRSEEVQVEQLKNGNLFLVDGGDNRFVEMNLLGQIVHEWAPPASYPIINDHDAILTDRGTIMDLSHVSVTVSNFPSSDTVSNPPLETASVDDSPVVEFSITNDAVLHVWSPVDILDPTRVTYLTYGEYSGSPYGVDNEHANALLQDTNNNSIIVSLRDQNTVFDFSRATGKLNWILSPHALWGTNWQPYLLTPEGTNFEWSYGQHGPMLTPQGTLLVYDDGIYRASPFNPPVPDQDNYSRGVEYRIDDTNMTVTQVWSTTQATNQDRLFTPIVGKTQWLPKTGNVLVTYGFVTYVNGQPPNPNDPGSTMARVIEYTHTAVPQVVFDLAFFDYGDTNSNYLGYWCYRAYRIPDLYAHPALPVTDLTVSATNGVRNLEFSADPTHSYVIQASTDLTNWTTIGTAAQQGGPGDFDFQDSSADQYTTRFYRVVTQ